ncbi:hypothetical protein PAXRUDRAFT_832721 [Paxillus rubicundulus Ve08.2h10]|uniref:MICOS complex subunit MIC19 n=1 Tax=Paxillus rubicundulus Ve08.2h10 TaxID=930991 RepID=A0A0D0DQH2_9AGAM|nr:hypothetical protein PAXRUDRAFT_832721 [Paxillus rubicundulus Ve08.2h10]
MGAGQSKPEIRPKLFYTETPIEFSQDVVDHLSDRLASPETTFERQATIDARIRAQIQSELKALRNEEENVQREIQRALEKENLDREIGGVGDGNVYTDIKNSSSLIGDLEEIRAKVDRFQTRNELDDLRSVKETGEAVALCYRSSATTPLDCWREVAQFKAAAADAEARYLASLR